MKAVIFFVGLFSFFLLGTSLTFADIPDQGQFSLTFSKVVEGPCTLSQPINANFHYKYNFNTDEGDASIISINNQNVNFSLYPEGIHSQYKFYFISDGSSTPFIFNGKKVNIQLSNLIIDTKGTGQYAAFIKTISSDGTVCTYASANYK